MISSSDSGQISNRVPADGRIRSIAHRRPNERPVTKTGTEPPITNRGAVAFIEGSREMVHRPSHLRSEAHKPAGAHIQAIVRRRLFKQSHQMVSLVPLNMEVVELLREKQAPIFVRPSKTADIRRLLFECTLQGEVSGIVSRCR